MAEIFLASAQGPEGFEKEVVIKRIRSFMSTDPNFVQMFIAEARLASRLNHANIVQIFDFDKHEDSFYIAMEYVRGHSLWDLRKRCREQLIPMPPTLVAQIGLDVARGLHYAHQLTEKGKRVGLVHRDVTPHNVLLSWEGAVKLTDFGIAKAGNKLTTPGMLKGKFAYMSPEQSRGEQVDARTDIFALGVVLWEMLTGGRLFEGDSDIAVLRAVQQSTIAPPGRLNSDVPAELDAVVMRALERDVDKRFQTAQELERELGKFILSHAKSLDDTDVGGFLRRAFADELNEEGRDRTATGVHVPLELQAPETRGSGTGPRKREPTAVMPSAGGSARRPTSWDEDAEAPTYVKGRLEPEAGDAAPSPRATLPMPVPAMVEKNVAPAKATAPAPVPRAVEQGMSAPTVKVAKAPERPSTVPTPGRTRQWGWIAGAIGLVLVGVGVAFVTQRDPSHDAAEQTVDAGLETVQPPLVPVQDAGVPDAGHPDAGPVDAGHPGTGPTEPAHPDAGISEPVDAGHAVPPNDGLARARGVLVINVAPWANVTIDGRSHGDIAGSRELTLPPGKYVVKFVHPRRTLEKVVTIRPGRRTSIEFDVFSK
ncbi:MAG: protein kinase [Myxococcaceae bacterium]|nr:protein kinase [Myxococcaceae bacterium]